MSHLEKNRIDEKFQSLKQSGKKAFIAFLTAGDPSLEITRDLILSFDQAGVDLIEIGVPFSDPLADGPTIQASSQRALSHGVTLRKILDLVKDIRKVSQLPIALMTYYNPVFHFPENQFVRAAKEAGVDGLIIPDLPPEEGKKLMSECQRQNLANVFFLAPTTTPQRMKKIVRASTGFIYYVSLTGVTGSRQEIPAKLLQGISFAKRFTTKPVCVGFGISNPKQIQEICRVADGVIVGSAIIQEIQKNVTDPQLVRKVQNFVAALVQSTHHYSNK